MKRQQEEMLAPSERGGMNEVSDERKRVARAWAWTVHFDYYRSTMALNGRPLSLAVLIQPKRGCQLCGGVPSADKSGALLTYPSDDLILGASRSVS